MNTTTPLSKQLPADEQAPNAPFSNDAAQAEAQLEQGFQPRSGDFAMDSPSFSTAQKDAAKNKFGTLFVVSTHIGNIDDISLRALKTLKQADIVVGEEGKTVARLLHDNRITKKLEELNEHNENDQTNRLLQLLKNGKMLALVSDAGTPLLADPGAQLVRRSIEAGITVRAIPGVTSIMTALTTSGLSMDSFVFAGFVSREPSERLQELKRLAQEPRTVVLLETPYRLVPLLEAARQIMPQRRAYLGCNLTMDSETHHYGTVSELYTKFVVSRFKGEFVFCFEGTRGGQAFVPQSRDDRKDDRRDDRRNDRRDGGKGAKGDFKREGGFQKREGGFQKREGGFQKREGGFQKREGGFQKREGDFKREGGDKREGEKRHDDKRFGDKNSGERREGGFKGKSGDSQQGSNVRNKPNFPNRKSHEPKGKPDTQAGNSGSNSPNPAPPTGE